MKMTRKREFGFLQTWTRPAAAPDDQLPDFEARFLKRLHARARERSERTGVPLWMLLDQGDEIARARARKAAERWCDQLGRQGAWPDFFQRFQQHLRKRRAETLVAAGVRPGPAERDFEGIAKKRAEAAAGRWRRRIARLDEERYPQIRRVAHGAAIAGPRTETEADKLAADLFGRAPWMAEPTNLVWRDLLTHIRRGGAGLRFRPLLLSGPPGCGKTAWATSLAAAAGVPLCKIDAGLGSAGFRIAGVEAGWGSAMPGDPVKAILDSGIGNPVVVVDEIDKATGGMWSTTGAYTSLSSALLSLLEPVSNAEWDCVYFRIKFDMSRVNWILVANRHDWLDPTLLSRCRLVETRHPTWEETLPFVSALAKERLGEERGELFRIAFERRGRLCSPRQIFRAIEGVEHLDFNRREH